MARAAEQALIPVVLGVGLVTLYALGDSNAAVATSPYGEVAQAAVEAAEDVEAPAPPSAAEIRDRCRAKHPLAEARSSAEMPAARIVELSKTDPETLGSASIGAPTRGALFNGVALEESEAVRAVSPSVAWGTETTVASIQRAAAEVRCRFPDTPTLEVGSISRRGGGPLWPHRSHQSGVDADLSFYYLDGSGWYTEATEDNFDATRTWALVDALVGMGNVQYLFIDRRLHEPIRRAAAELGEPESRLADLFEGDPIQGSVIRHVRGHDDHIHVRFDDEVARANARALLPFVGRRYAAMIRSRRRF